MYARPRRLWIVACVVSWSCSGSGGSSGASAGATGTGTASTGNANTSSDGADTTAGSESGTSGAGTTGPAGATTGGIPPSPSCADKELPPRRGAEVLVAPAGAGMVTVDGNITTLRSVVSSLAEGDTLVLADGIYTFAEAAPGEYTGIYVTTPNVTIRSESGDPSKVILDSGYASHGGQTAPITIDAPGVALAHLTVQRSIFHLVHLWENADGVLLHDLRLIDGGQQFVKASPARGAVDGVEVSCSVFRMTEDGRDNVWGYGPPDGATTCYTGGIDTHDATNWWVHDNLFEGIYCDPDGTPRPAHGKFPELRDGMTYIGGLAEYAVHMWDSAQGTGHRIERNRIVNCARGIGFGLLAPVHGGEIVNNMIFSEHPASTEHDVGILVERAVDTLVAHNTVYLSHPDAYPNAVEYRWDTTSGLLLHGNLTSGAITARDGATATEVGNVTGAESAWFVDAAGGDLHLADCTAPGSVARIPEAEDDYDGDARGDPTAPGADACPP